MGKYDVEINVCSPEEQEKRGNCYWNKIAVYSKINSKIIL